MIEIRHLMHAVTLAEHRNFARAAKVLHMSQPALTRSIQVLEERMGLPLFERMRSGVVPTDAGQLTLLRAKAILGQTDDLMREVGGIGNGEQEEIRVAAGPYPAATILGPAVASMINKHPGLRFKIEVGHWVETIGKLRERRVDFALCEASEVRDPELQTISMHRHSGYPVVRAGHPLSREKVNSMKQILKWPLAITARLPPRILEKLILATQSANGFEPAIHCEDVGFLKSLVLTSDAVGFFQLSMFEDELVSGRVAALGLDAPWMTTNFGLFHMKNRPLSPLAKDFIEELKSADERVAAKNQELAEFVARRPSQKAKGRKSATSKAK